MYPLARASTVNSHRVFLVFLFKLQLAIRVLLIYEGGGGRAELQTHTIAAPIIKTHPLQIWCSRHLKPLSYINLSFDVRLIYFHFLGLELPLSAFLIYFVFQQS